jgi:hypothetical protein
MMAAGVANLTQRHKRPTRKPEEYIHLYPLPLTLLASQSGFIMRPPCRHVCLLNPHQEYGAYGGCIR